MQKKSLVVVVASLFAAVAGGCGSPKVQTLVDLSEVNDCSVDEDCCIVVEECTSRNFIVTADEFADAVDAATFDEGGACAGCTAPAATVACVDGRCQGTAFSVDVSYAPGQQLNSCGPREVRDDDGDVTPPEATTFEQFFGCDGLNQ